MPPTMPTCPNCNASAGPAARFCSKCGFPISTAPKSNADLAAGVVKNVINAAAGAFPPRGAPSGPGVNPIIGGPSSSGPTAASASAPKGVLESWCIPPVIKALTAEEKAQVQLNSKFAAVVKLFISKPEVQSFIRWVSAQPESELKEKLEFARSKVGMDNQAFTSLVPVVCPELIDLGSLTKNSGEGFEALYWQIMGDALELLLIGQEAKEPEILPLPKVDPLESAAKQQHATMLQKLHAALETLSASDGPKFDALLQEHRRTGGEAVILIFERYLRTAAQVSDASVFIFRRLRRQLLYRFFVLMLSFYLNEKDAKQAAKRP